MTMGQNTNASVKRGQSPDEFMTIQSYDPVYNTFAGSDPGGKGKYLGAVWIGEPLHGVGDGQVLSLQSALSSSYPTDTVIQFGLLAAPDIKETVFDYELPKNPKNEVLRELVKRHSDLIKSGIDEPLVKASGVKLVKKRLIVTIKYPVDSITDVQLKMFAEYADKLNSGLMSAGIHLKRATAEEYLGICRLITHIYDKIDNRYDENLAINEQVFYNSDELVVNKSSIDFNTSDLSDKVHPEEENNHILSQNKNYVAKALFPKYFPKHSTLGMMNYVLGDPKGLSNQITDPYYIVMTMNYPEQVLKREAIAQKSAWIDHQMFGGSTGKFVPILAHKQYNFNLMREEIDTNSAVIVEANFTMWFFGKTNKRVSRAMEECRTYLSSLGFDMREDKLVLDSLFSETFPLNTTKEGQKGLFRSHTMTASQATQFLPLISEWRGTQHPTVLLTTRRGEVGGLDLFQSDSNYNAVIVAASGGGKSFLTQRIITDYLAEGAKIWVIDSGRSYQKLASAIGGTFMEFHPDSDICLNPFTSFLPERGGAGKSIDDEMDFLASLLERMAAQRETLDDLELETLKRAIRQTYIEHQGHSSVQNVADWLAAQHDDNRAMELALRLDSFAYGQYSKNFNGYANINLGNDFVVLELDDLKSQKQLQQVVLLQLVAQITHEMYLNPGRKKILIIDEAWELLDDPIMAKAMESAYRKARKYDGAVITITQGIADLYKSSNSRAMIENAAWQIILQQKSEAIDDVLEEGLLKLESYGAQQLKTVSTVKNSHSELMIMHNGTYGIFRLIVDKFTQVMFSTSGDERNVIMKDMNQGKNVIQSIEEYILGTQEYDLLGTIHMLIDQAFQAGISKREVERLLTNSINALDYQVRAQRLPH